MIPEHIQEAIGRYRPHVIPDNREVRAGDIRNIRTMDVRYNRLGVVLKVNNPRDGYPDTIAQVTLVHPYTELATNTDVVVTGEHKTVPYNVVVETFLSGIVWLSQLGTLVGTISEEALDCCWSDNKQTDNCYRGTHLAGSLDSRWTFKENELDEFQLFTEDCTAYVLDKADEYYKQRRQS